MTERKFHRTVIQVTLLSEEEIPDCWELGDIGREMDTGELVGSVEEASHEILDGREVAEALLALGSTPDFFSLTDTGDEI